MLAGKGVVRGWVVRGFGVPWDPLLAASPSTLYFNLAL